MYSTKNQKQSIMLRHRKIDVFGKSLGHLLKIGHF